MAYQSRLAIVLNARRTKQEVIQRELAVQMGQLLEAESILKKLKDDSESAMDALSQHQQGGGTPSEIGLYYQFVQYQAKKIQEQKTVISELETIYETKRKALEIATQEKVMIEKIEEKRKAAYHTKLKKKESDLLDELGGQMKWRAS